MVGRQHWAIGSMSFRQCRCVLFDLLIPHFFLAFFTAEVVERGLRGVQIDQFFYKRSITTPRASITL